MMREGRNGGKLKTGNTKNVGRPPKLPKLETLLEGVLGEEKDGMTAAEAILKMLRLKATKGDLRAAELLLDRAYGKAKQSIVQENTGEQTIKIIREVIHENPKD
jgi:phosphomannomutase